MGGRPWNGPEESESAPVGDANRPSENSSKNTSRTQPSYVHSAGSAGRAREGPVASGSVNQIPSVSSIAPEESPETGTVDGVARMNVPVALAKLAPRASP